MTRLDELLEKRDVLMDALREKYIEHLRDGVCRVTFTKKDGTERKMLCTLDMSGIPEKDVPKSDGNVSLEEGTLPETVRVYDLEKEAWRSFRLDSVTVFVPPKAVV